MRRLLNHQGLEQPPDLTLNQLAVESIAPYGILFFGVAPAAADRLAHTRRTARASNAVPLAA
jgi:hypothetical protein